MLKKTKTKVAQWQSVHRLRNENKAKKNFEKSDSKKSDLSSSDQGQNSYKNHKTGSVKMRVWWILKKSFKIKHCRKRSTGSNGDLKIRHFVQNSINFLMVGVLDLILPYQNSLHKLLLNRQLPKLPGKSRSEALCPGRVRKPPK